MEDGREKKERINQIIKYVKSLTSKEQDVLLSALRKNALLDQARKLGKSVKKNNLTMQEIVEEVRKVRSARS